MTIFTAMDKDRSAGGGVGTSSKADVLDTETTRYVKSVEGDIGQLPGSGTTHGSQAVCEVVRNTLDRVRRSIRSRGRDTTDS